VVPLTAALLLLVHACTGGEDPDPESGRVLVTDLAGGSWFVGDPFTGEVDLEVDLEEVDPAGCAGEDRFCMLYQARYRADEEVVFTWSPVDESDGGTLDRTDRLGRVAAWSVDTLSERWRLEALDFSAHFDPDGPCAYEVEDPCTPAATLTDREFQACQLYQPHDLRVVSDDGDLVDLWIADTRNARMLRVELEVTGSCGVVTEVIDRDRSADWDIYNSVNSFELEGDRLWMSVKDTFASADDGEQASGDGRGKVLHWASGADGWAQVWEFPPQSSEHESFVNSPHGVARQVTAEGTELVAFAHSLGRSTAYDDGHGASVGVLRVEDGEPRYLFDGVLAVEDRLEYSRDIEPLDEDRWLVTDTGCKSGNDCAWGTGVWVVRLDGAAAPADVTGAWSADGGEQVFEDLEVVGERRFEDFAGLYSTEWIGP